MSGSSQLFGLVLVGGQSTRMGRDKSMIDYHGQPQWQYAVDQLAPLVDKVFLSVRQGQTYDYPHLIADKYPGKGPFGALMTALETYPDTAFLVLATDIPKIDTSLLLKLIQARQTAKIATAFKGMSKAFAEPLICIWEPKALDSFHKNFQNKIFKIQNVLCTNYYKTVLVDDAIIQNINTLQDHKDYKKGH